MLTTPASLIATAGAVYAEEGLPRKLQLLRAAATVSSGADLAAVAASLRTPAKKLATIVAAPDPVLVAIGTDLSGPGRDEALMRRARGKLGTMLLGNLAERTFVKTYRDTMGTHELKLEDMSSRGTDTDYRVVNGSSRPVFRINIKFFGSAFRMAAQLVGLEPSDCFALATYKIHQAIEKQESEHLPYVFVVVGVHGMTSEQAGTVFPEDLVHFLAVVQASTLEKKRAVEDKIVRLAVEGHAGSEVVERINAQLRQIESAPWRVLSARRADKLLREQLFERVFAVRIKRFAQAYKGAEVDMHFSLSSDLTPLDRFFATMKSQGVHGISVALERGTV